MVIFENGKYHTVRTQEESMKLMEDELRGLSDEERQAFDQVLRELGGKAFQPKDPKAPAKPQLILSMLSEAEFIEPPVDLRTFVYDKYYLGNTCGDLWPALFEDLQAIFDGSYREVIFTGSIGWGKSYLTSIAFCRVLYELSLMRDPHKAFGLAPGTDISIVVLSVTEDLAKKVAFENIINKLKASPYFTERFPFHATQKEVRFPNDIWLAPRATTDTSALGLNVMSAWIDETDFIKAKGGNRARRRGAGTPTTIADALYTKLKARMQSRYGQQGKLPGFLFLVSSKNTSSSFSARLISNGMQDPELYVADHSTWEVKPEGSYSKDRFGVLVGNDQVASKILTPEEWNAYQVEKPEGCVLVEVPLELKKLFESNLEENIRDMAGVATISVAPFIQRREMILKAVENHTAFCKGKLVHPFSREMWEPGKGGEMVWSALCEDAPAGRRYRPGEMPVRPLVRPTAIRHVHIDPSLTGDCTGFCLAHIAGMKDVIRATPDGRQYRERAPIFFVDFLLGVVPPTGDEIILGDIRQFVYDFTAHGFKVSKVTLDGMQSADAIQILKRKGYDADRQSVDISPEAYINLKTALYEERVLMYGYEPLLKELREIQWDADRGKVDHPPTGSKDVADALAGCLFTLSEKPSHDPLPIMRIGVGDMSDLFDPERMLAMPGKPDRLADDPSSWRDIIPPFLPSLRG